MSIYIFSPLNLLIDQERKVSSEQEEAQDKKQQQSSSHNEEQPKRSGAGNGSKPLVKDLKELLKRKPQEKKDIFQRIIKKTPS